MNRRGLLALLGGAAAMPTVGVKAAASSLGVNAVGNVPDPFDLGPPGAPFENGWWGSPLRLAFDAKERAFHRLDRGDAYPHMKSWGRAFRQSQVEREELILVTYRRKMEHDAAFHEKVMAALGITK